MSSNFEDAKYISFKILLISKVKFFRQKLYAIFTGGEFIRSKVTEIQTSPWRLINSTSQWLGRIVQSIYDNFQYVITARKMSSFLPEVSKGWSVVSPKKTITS